MRYSLSFQESHVKKVLPPQNNSIRVVSKEAGISEQTLRNWLSKFKNGTLGDNNSVSGKTRSLKEKLNLVLKSKKISEENYGQWLRENGLYSEQINLYEQELKDMAEKNNQKEKQQIKDLKKENNDLKKELRKKEKALAEMAALYTLKKKAEAMWGEKEEE